MVDATTPHHLSSGDALPDRVGVRLRRWAPAAIILALILAFGFWAARLPNKQAEHTVGIASSEPYPSPEGRAISLVVDAGCTANGVVTAQVEERRSTIRILARAKNDYTPPGQPANACLAGVTIHLRSPLGHRVLVDASTGKVIKPR